MTQMSDARKTSCSWKEKQIPRKLLILGFLVFCVLCIGLDNIIQNVSLTEMTFFDGDVCRLGDCEDNIIIYNQTNFVNKTTKKILIWTSYFLGEWVDVSTYLSKSKYDCTVTSNRSEISSADAVLFHYLDLYPWDKSPGYRTPEQVWVMINSEAPPHLHYTGVPWLHSFNWTMTYRTDSTIYFPYGAFVPLTSEEEQKAKLKYQGMDFSLEKSKMVVAIISDCADEAQRYRDMDRLSKYVSVDFYGNCGNSTLFCPRKGLSECQSKKYRFRVAFENANCRDYVTEKFWLSLPLDTIPIVNWKKQDQAIEAPPYSYINVYDFQSMKEFSDYLIMLSKNSTLYNEYFKWKLKYKVPTDGGLWAGYPKLCDGLHTPRLAQTIVDPNKWIRTDSCHKWSISGVLQRHWDRLLFDWGW